MSSAGKHYLRVCRPAFIAVQSTYISNNSDNPLFGIILGEEEKILGRAEEYGERAWRMKGSRHTVVVWDEGNGYYNIIAVEECHHDDSILDELYAAACVLADIDEFGKEVLVKHCSPETIRRLVAEHFDYIYQNTTEWDFHSRKNPPIFAPPQVLAEIIREAKIRGKHEDIIKELIEYTNKEQFSSLAQSIVSYAPDLKRSFLIYLV